MRAGEAQVGQVVIVRRCGCAVRQPWHEGITGVVSLVRVWPEPRAEVIQAGIVDAAGVRPQPGMADVGRCLAAEVEPVRS